jgi:hypothetical protein
MVRLEAYGACHMSAAIAIQLFAEAQSQVSAHAVGDRVVVTIGTDVSGVRLMGDIADVRQVVVQALDRLAALEGR